MRRDTLRAWALKGAEQRLLDLAAEARAIYLTFPELRNEGRENPGPSAPRRRRRRMSAAQRRAVGARMKKYWAARRKARKAR